MEDGPWSIEWRENFVIKVQVSPNITGSGSLHKLYYITRLSLFSWLVLLIGLPEVELIEASTYAKILIE